MLYGLLTVVEKIFGTWNTGVKCARENWAQIYILLGHLISTQKLLFMAMFAGIILCCALTLPLPVVVYAGNAGVGVPGYGLLDSSVNPGQITSTRQERLRFILSETAASYEESSAGP